MRLLSTPEIIAKYGKPNQSGTYLVSIPLPYPMRLAWDLKTRVNTMRCHRLVADDFKAVFHGIRKEYTLEQIKGLDIDLFGGCFNFRAMRNGTDWSRHAWGIAIDLSPEKNGLNTPWAKSQFARPEYAAMHAAFEAQGFLNLGKVWQRDVMHFEKSI